MQITPALFSVYYMKLQDELINRYVITIIIMVIVIIIGSEKKEKHYNFVQFSLCSWPTLSTGFNAMVILTLVIYHNSLLFDYTTSLNMAFAL